MWKKLKNHFACDADQCIDTKVKCPKGGASFVLWSKNPVIYLGYVKGGWTVLEMTSWYINEFNGDTASLCQKHASDKHL